jgi:sec-independent protein translocase protein TatC
MTGPDNATSSPAMTGEDPRAPRVLAAVTDSAGGLLKPLVAHLDDLRRALAWGLGALVIGMGLAAALAPRLLAVLKAPLAKVTPNPDSFLRALEVTGALSVATQTIVWGGALIAAPAILGAIAWFVFPALTARERRTVLAGMAFAALLFGGGVAFCYFLALAPALKVMLWFNDWLGIGIEYVTVTSYVGFVLKLLLSFGLTFELPMALWILGRLGLVTAAQLRAKRRHAVVAILILAMVITPTQDPFSQLLLAGPLIVLYELCLWLLK